MRANRFYTVPYDARNDTKVRKLGKLQKGKMAAYGRWQALLGVLYDEDGIVDMSDPTTSEIVCEELEFRKPEQADRFFSDCAEAGLLDASLWESARHVVSPGVCEQIAYKAEKASYGKSGGRGRKKGVAGGVQDDDLQS